MQKVRAYFVHCQQGDGYDRCFDTIMMPTATVASVNAVYRQMQQSCDFLVDPVAIDETYPGSNLEGREHEYVLSYLRQAITEDIRCGIKPVVLCTLLSYNAQLSLELLKTLKNEFGSRVRTGVGGQLVRIIPDTYRQLSFIDYVSVGDAEVTLPAILLGDQSFVEGYLKLDPAKGIHYTNPDYHNYLGLEERLAESAKYRFGPFTNIRQLCVESVRGCSWAYAHKKVCEMCSLQGTDTKPVFQAFSDHFALQNQLAHEFGATWLFDVSNQWIPVTGGKRQVDWLRSYIVAKKQYSQSEVNKYVYLTANSVTAETAPLLREAGIKIAYIGFDGWEAVTRRALHKPNINPFKVLQLCQDHGIYVRTSFVIGAGLNNNALVELPKIMADIVSRYGETILTMGSLLQIIIPGSPAWHHLQTAATNKGWQNVLDLFQCFYSRGYLTWAQEEELTKLYIQYVQKMDYEAVVQARDESCRAVNEAAKVSGSDVRSIAIHDGGYPLSE